MSGRAVFHDVDTQLRADTCSLLKKAGRAGALELYGIGRGYYPGLKIRGGELEGVRSIGYWDAKTEQSFGLGTHCNEGIEISYCEAGELSFTCEGRRYALPQNTVSITRPWQPHSLGNPNIEISKLHWLIIDVQVRRPHQQWIWPDWIVLEKRDLNGLTRILRENEIPIWGADREIGRIFNGICRDIRAYGEGGVTSSLKLGINELLLDVYLMIRARRPSLNTSLTTTERSVRMFLKRLPEMLDTTWTGARMAECCHLKPTRFIHYCKKITNMAPIQYLNFLRIGKAKSLLEKTDMSIIDIALECGFSSSQYFNRLFKAFIHLTPMEYRKTARSDG